MNMLEIIVRKKEFVNSYKEYCHEFYDNNILTFRPTNPSVIDDDWFERTAEWYEKKEQGLLDRYAKGINYWVVDGEKFIGEFHIRTELDKELMTSIGSIGYSVRITEWGKGYGKEILKQGLKIAKKLGLEKVLLTISDNNIASIHVCEANGGVLMDKIMTESKGEGLHLTRRYWIYL